jgi:hypothetical protein
MGNGSLYRSSDGRYFGDADVWERFETGDWTPCCWDTETGEEWIETRDGDVLRLRPVPAHVVPDWVEVDRDADGVRTSGRPMTAD